MHYSFSYSAAIERATMLSSYEGRDYTDDEGNSLYTLVHIREQDEPLMLSYCYQAATLLHSLVERMLTDVDLRADGFTWFIRTETRWNRNSALDANVLEAIIAYILSHWLADKKADAVEKYTQLWELKTAAIVQNLFRKQPPSAPRPPQKPREQAAEYYEEDDESETETEEYVEEET